MNLSERILHNLKTILLVHDKLRELNERVDALGHALNKVDRRLIRVETVLEFATEGRFRQRLLEPDEGG